MRERRKRKASEKQAGQGFVEFALILPVLLLLMFGVIEFGRLLFIYTEVSNAAREAVRFGAVRGEQPMELNYQKCPSQHPTCDICEAGNSATVLTNLEDSDFTIVLDNGMGEDVRDCLTSPAPVYVAGDGDRLVITVTYQFRPLVLFQDAGPFQVQFTSARTLVGEGIVMSGFDDVPAGSEDSELEVPAWFDFVHDPRYPAGCYGYFHWAPVHDAHGYRLYEWFPEWTEITSTLTLTYPLQTHPVHIDGIEVLNGQIFYVQAYQVGDPVELEDSAPSNYEVVACLDQAEDFRYEPDLSCTGAFEWTEAEYVDGYHLYTPDMITVTTGCPAGKCSYSMDLTTTGPFTLTAYNSVGDGDPSSIEVLGCTYPLDHPLLEFTKTSSEPCVGFFEWEDSDDALGYRLIRLPSDVIADNILPGTLRYPLGTDTVPVADGEQYQLVPFGRGERESGHSNVETIVGCVGAPPSETTLFLHSAGTGWPLCLDHEGDPPLPMDGNRPSCWGEHVYNPPDTSPGRKVLGGGRAPDIETNLDTFLAWHSVEVGASVNITSEVHLYLWYKNTSDSAINASVSLCGYSITDGYDCVAAETLLLTKKTYTWEAATMTWTPNLSSDLDRLALYITHDGGADDDVWFMYDKEYAFDPAYDSRIEFTGGWHP